MNFANTSLFIGDLPKFCNEVDLEQLFAPFGPILDVKIKRNVNTGKTLSYGFVTFSSEATASEALRRLDGTMFYGRKLRLRWAMYNARSHSSMFNGVINSVYVRFVTSRVDQFITEEDLHRVFEAFGSLVDVSIKESSVDPRLNRQSGYGFVHYACDSDGVEAAFHAVSAMDNAVIDGVTYNVELSKNLLRQFNETTNNNSNNNNSNGSNNEAYGSSPGTAPSFPPSPSLGSRGPTPPLSGARIPLPPSPNNNNNMNNGISGVGVSGMSPSSSLAHLPTSGYRSAGGASGVAMMQDFPPAHTHTHTHSRHSSRSASPSLSLSLSAVSPSGVHHSMRGPSPLRLPPQHPLTPTGNNNNNNNTSSFSHYGARQSPSPSGMGFSRTHTHPHTHAQSPQSYRSSSPSALVGIAALSDSGTAAAPLPVSLSGSAQGVPPPPPAYRSPHTTHHSHTPPLGLHRNGSNSGNINMNINGNMNMNMNMNANSSGYMSPALSLRSASPSSQTSYLDPHSHGLSLAHTQTHTRVQSGGSAAGSAFFDAYGEQAHTHAPTPPLSARVRGYSHDMCPPSPLSTHSHSHALSHTHSISQPHSGHHSLSTSPSASFLDTHMYAHNTHNTHSQHSPYAQHGSGLGLDVYFGDSNRPVNAAGGIMNNISNNNSYYNNSNNTSTTNNNGMTYDQYYANSPYYSPRVNAQAHTPTHTPAHTQGQNFFPVTAANNGIAGGVFAAEDAALLRQYEQFEYEQAALRERERERYIERDRDLFFGLRQQSVLESLISTDPTDLTLNTQFTQEGSESTERVKERARGVGDELDALINDCEFTQKNVQRKESNNDHEEEALRDASRSLAHLSLTLSDDEQS